MSPMAKALLALLATYAATNLRQAPSEAPTSPSGRSGGTVTADNMPGGGQLDDLLKGPLGGLLRGGQGAGTAAGGGLGDLLKGPLGGLLAGAAAGTAINGGLGDLLKQLQQNGQGDAVNSWIGSGPNKPIQGRDLESALGSRCPRYARQPDRHAIQRPARGAEPSTSALRGRAHSGRSAYERTRQAEHTL